MIHLVGLPTIRRYERAWQLFWSLATLYEPSVADLGCHAPDLLSAIDKCPLWKIALALKRFAQAYSPAQARNAYSALMLLPCCQHLRYETCLRPLKRQWGASKPKYSTFYEVEPLLGEMLNAPLPTSEEGVRERLVLLLRLACLFRGCDLKMAHRNVNMTSQPWLMYTKRKGKQYYAWYPVPRLHPVHVDPQYFMVQNLSLTSEVAGPALFYSLPKAGNRYPLKSDTINSITTKYLHARGLKDWSAHSTRGAAATALLVRGFKQWGTRSPQIV